MAMPELKAALGCKERWVGKEVLKDLSGSEEEKEKEDAAEQAEPAEPARTETAQSTEGRPARKRSALDEPCEVPAKRRRKMAPGVPWRHTELGAQQGPFGGGGRGYGY
ncbi:unnamed protein product [Effrenium voratum]|nr:unnamed protein product [Effrenium voratum]